MMDSLSLQYIKGGGGASYFPVSAITDRLYARNQLMERMRESYPARDQQWWNTFTISTPHESEEAHGFLVGRNLGYNTSALSC